MEGLCQGFVSVSETKLDILRVSVNADVLLLWVEVESNPSVRRSALSCPHQPTVQWCLLLACRRTPSPLSSPCMKVHSMEAWISYNIMPSLWMLAFYLPRGLPMQDYGRRLEMEKV